MWRGYLPYTRQDRRIAITRSTVSARRLNQPGIPSLYKLVLCGCCDTPAEGSASSIKIGFSEHNTRNKIWPLCCEADGN